MKTFTKFISMFALLAIYLPGQTNHDIILSESATRPTVVTDQRGNAFVSWTEIVPIDGSSALAMNYAVYDSTGFRIKAPTSIADTAWYNPPVIIPGKNDILCLWTEIMMEPYTYGQLMDYNGNELVSVNYFTQATFPAGFANEDSSYTIVLAKYCGGIFFLKYFLGETTNIKEVVSNPSGKFNIRTPKLLHTNRLSTSALVWADDRSGKYQIFTEMLNNDGTPIGTQILVNEDTLITEIFYFAASMDISGKFTVVWSGNKNNVWQIHKRSFNSDGTPLGPEEKVSSDNETVLQYACVDIAENTTGEFIVAWEGKKNGISNIFIQRYDREAKPQGEIVGCASDADSDYAYYPSVALYGSKIFLAWQGGHSALTAKLKVMDFNNPISEVNDKSDRSSINQSYFLAQNYPNPFNPSTSINFQLPKESFVSVKIYDALGREIISLVNGIKQKGNYTATFDASHLRSGIYFCTLKADRFTQTKKMLLLK